MCRSLTEVNFRIFRKIFSLSTSTRPPGTLSPMEKRKTVSRQRSLSKRKLQILVTIHICLCWILETHHQKEWIVPRQSVFSREGLALYYPWLVSCFSQKLSLTWHRNCKLGNTSKLFTMTEGLKKLQPLAKGDVVRVLPLPGQSKWFKVLSGGSGSGTILQCSQRRWKSLSPQPLSSLQGSRKIPSNVRWWISATRKNKPESNAILIGFFSLFLAGLDLNLQWHTVIWCCGKLETIGNPRAKSIQIYDIALIFTQICAHVRQF